MSLKDIHITRWFPNKTTKKYSFSIYEDDSIEDGILKLVSNIKESGRFYVWNNIYKSILFSISDYHWNGYNYNPLYATDTSNSIIKEPIIYNYNKGLCYFNSINIIFEKDFPELENNQYYFIDIKNKTVLNDSQLKALEDTSTDNIIDNYNIIHKYELTSKFNSKLLIANLYLKLNTNPLIQYIQWINDTYTLIHKLYLYHNINHTYLKNWTNIDKITTTHVINCFSFVSDNSYCKISITPSSITVNYYLDLRKNITWDKVEPHFKKVVKYLENRLKFKSNFNPVSIKIHNYINISNVPFDVLKTNISKFPQIFNIISTKDTINLIYKRSSNYSAETFDYSKYIKNRLLLGIDNSEIIDELISFGLSKEEAKKMISAEEELLKEIDDKMIKETNTEKKINTFVIIKNIKTGFEIIIYNCPNKKEFEYLIFWLSRIISISQKKIDEIKKKIPIKKKEKTPSKSPSPLPSPTINSDESLGELLNSSSSSSQSSTSGGNNDKEEQRYRVQLLQNADKDLFGENYARNKCQKKNQPFVISKETRDKLVEEGRYYTDNDVYYGSRKDKMNYYLCPKLWCKVSKVPADPITKKCPRDDDEIIVSFFDNKDEEDVKRYVKLIKPNENDLCAPCCFKKPPKPNELSKCKNYETYNPKKAIEKIEYDEKDENYLVNYSAPIPLGRYGIVPQFLHEFLFPSIKYNTCSKDLNKSDKCLVRKGIIHKKINKENTNYPDSLIFCFVYLLNFKDKNQFINDIKKRLDLISFLSIENGNVCKAFMDRLPLIPKENLKLIEELKNHLTAFPLLNSLYKINFNLINTYELSRLLGIYKSYKKFINYIEINDYHINKSSYYFYSLIVNLYNKLLVVWEKEGTNTNIICPYFTTYNDLISSMEINPEVIMILKDKKYFEPLEVKSKNKDGIKIFNLNSYSKLKSLLNSCSIHDNDNHNDNTEIYNKLYSLNNWSKTKGNGLDNPNKFIIDTIIINNDLTIEHFLTKGNILITIKKIGISYLPRIIKDLNISSILFYEDLVENSTVLNINVNLKDLNLFKDKAISFDVKYDIGELNKEIPQKEPLVEVYTILIIKKKPLNNNYIIHSRIDDDLYLYQKDSYEENKRWFQLQIMVINTILKNIDEKRLKELHQMNRIDYVKELSKLFNSKIPYMNEIKLIIEEIPIYSISHIKNYLNKLLIYYKYDFLNPTININKNNSQFEFSQIALNNGIPFELLNYHSSAPYNNFIHSNYEINDYSFNTDIIDDDSSTLPLIFKGTLKKLNTKWTMHKKNKWYQMEIIKINGYSKETFKEFFNWFANYINVKVNFNNLQEITNNKLKIIKDDEDNLKLLLKDTKLFKLFMKVSDKSYPNVNSYYSNYFNDLSIEEKNSIINKIIKNDYPLNDLYILSMAEILNINILTIHRAIYSTSKDDYVRGNIEDLLISTTFYKATNNHYNRPLIIFYKDYDANINETVYYLVVDKSIPISTKSIYLKLSEIPTEIKLITEEHLKRYH
jgi:hypothetical protein